MDLVCILEEHASAQGVPHERTTAALGTSRFSRAPARRGGNGVPDRAYPYAQTLSGRRKPPRAAACRRRGALSRQASVSSAASWWRPRSCPSASVGRESLLLSEADPGQRRRDSRQSSFRGASARLDLTYRRSRRRGRRRAGRDHVVDRAGARRGSRRKRRSLGAGRRTRHAICRRCIRDVCPHAAVDRSRRVVLDGALRTARDGRAELRRSSKSTPGSNPPDSLISNDGFRWHAVTPTPRWHG